MRSVDPMSPFADTLERLNETGELIGFHHLPARSARYGQLDVPLPSRLGMDDVAEKLWSHQADAINAIRQGEHVVIATSTASGKSRCFQIPIAEAVTDPDQPGTALLIYPTKALAQDQLRSFQHLNLNAVVAGTYDGDTPANLRGLLRRQANVLLTNPEMLHHGMLSQHPQWGHFLRRLRYVVIDELHVLRGVFGTHVAHVLRRLRRLCDLHGANPTFIFTSATIGQPERLAKSLCGMPVTAISDDGSPSGGRSFALVDPPVFDETTGERLSPLRQAARLGADLIERGHHTITFGRSRKGTEVISADMTRHLPDHLQGTVMAYRAGYLPEERREIEHLLATGALRGVVATSALELGIDIGELDACILTGFPGTIASMWQQAGRVGRDRGPSLAVLIAGDDQLDRYLVQHPDEVFVRPPEPSVVNLSNPFILLPHLACAAFESPLSVADERWWPAEDLHNGVRDLVSSGQLRMNRPPGQEQQAPQAHWIGSGRPSRSIGLRSGSTEQVAIIDQESRRVIGTVDTARAYTTVHQGAVYLHQGRHFTVSELNLTEGVALVGESDGATYTQPKSAIDLRIRSRDAERRIGRATLHLGEVEVATTVGSYQLRDAYTRALISNHQLDLPEERLITRAFWYQFDPEVINALLEAGLDPGGSLHAAEHAAIGMLPLFTICDRWDVGGVSTIHHSDTGQATVFIYDGYPGGSGIAELGWEASAEHMQATLEAITGCRCREGCPSCIQSPKCGNGNDPLDKAGSRLLLEQMLDSSATPSTSRRCQ